MIVTHSDFLYRFTDTLNCTARITYEERTCDFKYTYSFNDHRTMLKILDQDCSQTNVIAAAFGITLLTVVLGLIVMAIIRMRMFLVDRRLYQQFEKEQQNETSYQLQSPLYKSPISSFTVPEEMADSELR